MSSPPSVTENRIMKKGPSGPNPDESFLVFPETGGYGFCRADCRAFAAAYALSGVRLHCRIDVHRTYFTAFAAGYTGVPVQMHAVQTDFIEQPVDRAKRAHYLAEEPAAYYAADDRNRQYRRLEKEQSAELRS